MSLINQLDDSKFSGLLARILQKLHLKDEHSFSEEEERKLQRALGLSAGDVSLVLETLAFLLEQVRRADGPFPFFSVSACGPQSAS